MEDQVSTYQYFKIWLAGYLPIDRDVLHVLIGLTLVLIAAFMAHRRRRSGPFIWAFVISCVLAIVMEALDMRDDIRTFGVWRWRASLLDIVRTISVPSMAVMVVVLIKRSAARRSD